MKHHEKVAPLAAALTALTTLTCCLPLGFAAAAAAASLSAIISPLQPWLLVASVGLLLVGVVQLRSARRTCATRSSLSLIILCVSSAIVLMVIFFPQALAGFLADWLPGESR